MVLDEEGEKQALFSRGSACCGDTSGSGWCSTTALLCRDPQDSQEEKSLQKAKLQGHQCAFLRRKDGLRSEFLLFHKQEPMIWLDGQGRHKIGGLIESPEKQIPGNGPEM